MVVFLPCIGFLQFNLSIEFVVSGYHSSVAHLFYFSDIMYLCICIFYCYKMVIEYVVSIE